MRDPLCVINDTLITNKRIISVLSQLAVKDFSTYTRSGFKTAFVTRTSEIYSRKAEVQNRRRHSQSYVEDEFCADNTARVNCSRSQWKLSFETASKHLRGLFAIVASFRKVFIDCILFGFSCGLGGYFSN
jgi:hypothetical protein